MKVASLSTLFCLHPPASVAVCVLEESSVDKLMLHSLEA